MASRLHVIDADRQEPVLDAPAEETPADGLVRCGWWSCPAAVDPGLIARMQQELQRLLEADRLYRAGIGRDRDYQLDRSVRGDRIFWLTAGSPEQSAFLAEMENLRLALNRDLFMGLFEFEAHFAWYPPGARYRRHYDSFRGAANRVISTIVYLNENWQPGDGGELVLYRDDGEQVMARIEPRAGTLVVFLSEEIPHEVLPATRPRASIAGWYRLNASRGGQVDPAL